MPALGHDTGAPVPVVVLDNTATALATLSTVKFITSGTVALLRPRWLSRQSHSVLTPERSGTA